MPQIEINNFKGINLDEGLWNQGYARYVVGINPFGLNDNASLIAYPGVLQNQRSVSAMSVSAVSGFNSVPTHMITFYESGTQYFYAIDENSTPFVYRATNIWAQVSAVTLSAIGIAGGGLAPYNGRLFVSQDAGVTQYTPGGAWTNLGSFSSSTANPRPMKQLAGNMYIGNNQYISKITSTFVFTAAALTLPSDAIVRSMETYGDYLYIMTDNNQLSRMYVWDGISTTYQSFIDIKGENVGPALLVHEGRLWAYAPATTTLYVYTGSSFEKIISFPVTAAGGATGRYSSLTSYINSILIGNSDPSGADYEDGAAGIWMLTRQNPNEPYQLSIAFNPAGGVLGTTIGGILSVGTNLLIAAQTTSGSINQIFQIQGTATNTSSIWQSLPIDAGDKTKNKTWNAIRIGSESVGTSNNIVIKYRLDYATAWTTLSTITANPNRYIPIGRTGRVIEIRLELGSAASGQSTRVHNFTLDYTLGNE